MRLMPASAPRRGLHVAFLVLGVVVTRAGVATAQARVPAAADSAAIRATALDYIEGWYEGNGDRMQRALHPELAKRILMQPPQPGMRPRLDQQSAMTLTNNTRAGGGKRTPPERQQKDVTILDIYQNAASARIEADSWVDYLHLVRADGRWQIVNVLWELKPRPQ